MRAEQVLREVRIPATTGGGGDGGSLAFRTRLEEASAAFAPVLLILGLALAGGGFGLSDRHIAGLAVWLLLAVLLTLGAAGRATLGRPFYWAVGSIGAFALFSAFSSFWSESIELTVIEADRVVVYLGFFVAAFLIAQTDRRRERFGEGTAIALLLVAGLALGSRLLPDVLSVSEAAETGSRLSYPLGYWNGDGVMFGMGMGLALWLSRNSLVAALRWIAVASMPICLIALYFTYSRGGLLALAISCGCLIVLSPERLWLLGTLGAGALGAVPAALAIQSRTSLAEHLDDSHIAGQGFTVFWILLLGCLLAVGLFAALRRLERRQGSLTGRAVAVSRNPRLLRGFALLAALLAIGVAIGVGGRAWHQFTTSDVNPPGAPEDHFTQLSSSGRDEFWRVALDAFDEKPALGHGAGTYRISWHLLRDNSVSNLDAHSLYLQALSELGAVGAILILFLVFTLLAIGVFAWRGARGRQRELCAALLGVSLAFAIASAIDWFWQIAAMGAVFFLATGVLTAARCAQLNKLRLAGEPEDGTDKRRFGLAIGGLAIAWISALALIGPLLVDREISASNSAAAGGNLASAVSHADVARSIEPWAAAPYKQLGLLAEAEGNYPQALERLDQALDRESESWLLHYLRARVEAKAGDKAAAEADLAKARSLNPRELCLLAEGFEGCG
jgi:O-antigen ligase